MIVSRLQKTEFEGLEKILQEAELPAEDLDQLNEVYVARVNEKVVGYFALEIYDQDALLRSVVVTRDNRGKGHGNSLVPFMLKVAQNNGVKTLYLLTTTASDFFKKAGFEVIERQETPIKITETREFKDFCPDSAIVMKLELDEEISI